MIPPDEWQPAGDMMLEPNALKAVTSSGRNIVVTAGPGSGKTELLAQRADFLLRAGQCRYPRRILAVSFKVDAAKNLADRVRRRCPAAASDRLDSYTFHAFAKRLIDNFRPVLTGIDALDPDYSIGDVRIPNRQIDFQSMAPLATTIIENSPAARLALRLTYEFVFLDEFQDCTANQYSLIKAAFHGTETELISVGDVKQRIMGWAGALDGIFARFVEDFDADRQILYLNFRSKPRLRRMQNAMIRVMEPGDALDDGSIDGDGGTIEVLGYRNETDEARDVAERIRAWITVDGVPGREIAVLVSKNVDAYTEVLRAELRSRQVPFRKDNDLQELATEPVAALIVDFLTVVAGDREPEAYARLMNVAAGRFSDDDEYAQRAYSALRRFVDEAQLSYRGKLKPSLRSLVDRFLEHFGDDVLAGLAPQYQQGTRLRDLINQVSGELNKIYAETQDVPKALREFTGDESIRIMTIHKAKGLEFESVVVLAVESETFWSDDSQERSAYFVAISRARNHLCLTHVTTRSTPTDPPRRWEVARTPHAEFLAYAEAT